MLMRRAVHPGERVAAQCERRCPDREHSAPAALSEMQGCRLNSAGAQLLTSASDGSTAAPSTYLKSTMVAFAVLERELADKGAHGRLVVAARGR